MEKSVERRAIMQSMLDSMGVRHHRIKGLSNDEIHVPDDVARNWNRADKAVFQSSMMPPARSSLAPNHPLASYTAVISGLYGRRRKNRLNELGCTASHLIAMKTAVNDQKSQSLYALIIEDDVQFPFDIDFDALVASAPPDWAILQLFNSNEGTMAHFWNTYMKRAGDKRYWLDQQQQQQKQKGGSTITTSIVSSVVNSSVVYPKELWIERFPKQVQHIQYM